MPSRLARERAFDLEQAARKRAAAAIEAAGTAKRTATDAAYAARDRLFDVAREALAAERRARPRDPDALARCEQAVKDAKVACKVAPDLTDILAAHARTTADADRVLTAELADIRRQLRAGELEHA